MTTGLRERVATWHPDYRWTLAWLLFAGTLASGLAYVQNALLGRLMQTLAAEPGRPQPWAATPLDLPAALLGLFVASRVAAGAVEFWKTRLAGLLTLKAGDDLETELLIHLLRKDDAFFSRHSPAETVNRLAVDLHRVSEARPGLMKICWSSLLVLGNVVFFLQKDWLLALVAVAGCAAGALWTMRTTDPIKAMDSRCLQQDDRVKSRFEDLLRTAPEVQTGALYDKLRRSFRELLGDRGRLFMEYTQLGGALRVGSIVSYLGVFVAMVLVLLHMRRHGAAAASVALVPVVIYALPGLFNSASELVLLRLELHMVRASMDRLLQYESQAAESRWGAAGQAPEEAGPAEPLRLAGAAFRYPGPDGARQGGLAGATMEFPPGRWTAVVGPAGSGKSTLLKLLLGRLKPQAGSVSYGGTPLEELHPARRATLFSLMPQSIALLNDTILQNLLFGRPRADAALSAPDLDVVEKIGLGRVCRLKALDMPCGAAGQDGLGGRVAGLRGRLRALLDERCGAAVRPFEEGHADPGHWLLERLLAGRCDRALAAAALRGPAGRRVLGRLAAGAPGGVLIEAGRAVLLESRRLLGIQNYHVYCQLAPFPLDERLWRLRTESLAWADKAAPSAGEGAALCAVALTSTLAELARPGDAANPAGGSWPTERYREEVPPPPDDLLAALKGLLDGCWRPFAADEVHPHLTWRENLVFGAMDSPNLRGGQLLDQAILDFIRSEGLQDLLTLAGLGFEIGRLGGNLSGGQGQLVALGRALLRRTPVLVLDEPTSALDPASRAAVASMLKEWRPGRVIITVSHDVEFIREADEVMLLDSGRLAGSGSFQELREGSAAFRRALAQA